MSAVEIRGLTKRFKDTVAVDGLNLSVPEGSIYGFLGPNGAGKTTTLKMLAGLIKPDAGEISIAGHSVHFGKSLPPDVLGYLPDVPGFYPWMRAAEFLRFCARLFGMPDREREDRIDELLSLVGLTKAKNKRIAGFSRGMRQRLGIAQALINRPKVVLMDEPASALDPIGRKEVMDIIRRLVPGATVFFSTHILDDVERICDQVAILGEGRLLLTDTMDAIRKQYAHPSVVVRVEEKDTERLRQVLAGMDWVQEMTLTEDGQLHIGLMDVAAAGRAIPKAVTEMGMSLLNYQPMRPALEDIFVEVVKQS
jgi:ABC-2 type transport system ATP-binding protein